MNNSDTWSKFSMMEIGWLTMHSSLRAMKGCRLSNFNIVLWHISIFVISAFFCTNCSSVIAFDSHYYYYILINQLMKWIKCDIESMVEWWKWLKQWKRKKHTTIWIALFSFNIWANSEELSLKNTFELIFNYCNND